MALSTEKRHLKYLFKKANEKTPKAEKIHKYLQEVHSVNVPEDFASQLLIAHYDFRCAEFDMSLELVDTIIEACEHWREFVDNWDALVCKEILSMARIHTSVIHRYFLIKDGFSLKKLPSLYMETTVTAKGKLCFCDR